MHLSTIFVLIPAALALVTPTHMKRDDLETVRQQIDGACNSASSTISSLAGQAFGSSADLLQKSGSAVDEHCAGLVDVLGRLIAAQTGPGTFEEADEAAAGRFDG